MKKTTMFLVLIMLICLISCDTVTNYAIRIPVNRHPTLTIDNQTGHHVIITAPVSTNITNGARTQHQPADTSGIINVTYRIDQIELTEQVTMNNADATVILTRRPPVLTIANQTGYLVNIIAPLSTDIGNNERIQFQSSVMDGIIDVTYRIGQINFTEQVTINNADATVTLTRRPPTITVVNQTNNMVSIIAPERSPNIPIPHGGNTHFLSPAFNQNINIMYSIGRMSFTEQVAMQNQDVTVTLTRRPPTITVLNNVGVTVNNIFIRITGSPSWLGGNIVYRDNRAQLGAAEGAQIGVISGSIINNNSIPIWFGDLDISGDSHISDYRYDIRIDDVQGNTYVKNNVQIINDLELIFTRSDIP